MALIEARLESEAYAAIWAELSAKGFVHSSGNAVNDDYNDRFVRAVAKGIAKVVPHIVTNSELVPVSTDSGTAGSGIITGKVK